MSVRLFGHYRDIAGDELTVDIADGASVRNLAAQLVAREPRLSLLATHCRAAVNYEYVPSDTMLHEGDEVAFIPPMSGG